MARPIFQSLSLVLVLFPFSVICARPFSALPPSYRPRCLGDLPGFITSEHAGRVYQNITDLCAGPEKPNLFCACYVDGLGDGKLACGSRRRYEEPAMADSILPYCESQCSCTKSDDVSTDDLYKNFQHREDLKKGRRKTSVWWLQEILDRVWVVRTSTYLEALGMTKAQAGVRPMSNHDCIMAEGRTCQTTEQCQAYCGHLVCLPSKVGHPDAFGVCLPPPNLDAGSVEKATSVRVGRRDRGLSLPRRKRDTMFDPSRLIGNSCVCDQDESDSSCLC